MAIFLDQIVTHDSSNTGDSTVPLGVDGLAWCHLISDTSLVELQDFLTSVGLNPAIIRMPAPDGALPDGINPDQVGSNVTYAGLGPDDRDIALVGGASPQRRNFCILHTFDAGDALYEPLLDR